MKTHKSLKIDQKLAQRLINEQFPEFKNFPIKPVKKQGHDNKTFRLGNDMLIRMPTASEYALKVPIEQAFLPKLKPHLTVPIPEPIKMGAPSCIYPLHFSIYKWLEGDSANNLDIDSKSLETIAKQLAIFLNELRSIHHIDGPVPGQHNWWRGSHISVYSENAQKQIDQLKNIIDINRARKLWEQASQTKWNKAPVWIHGDFSSGNILFNDTSLTGVIDFGGMGTGDPACDLGIAWTFLKEKSRQIFIEDCALDDNTWLRAKAWCLWKSTFELCQVHKINSKIAEYHKDIIYEILK